MLCTACLSLPQNTPPYLIKTRFYLLYRGLMRGIKGPLSPLWSVWGETVTGQAYSRIKKVPGRADTYVMWMTLFQERSRWLYTIWYALSNIVLVSAWNSMVYRCWEQDRKHLESYLLWLADGLSFVSFLCTESGIPIFDTTFLSVFMAAPLLQSRQRFF